MKNVSIEERAVELAHYIIDSKDTVRGAAKKFGISKRPFCFNIHVDGISRSSYLYFYSAIVYKDF